MKTRAKATILETSMTSWSTGEHRIVRALLRPLPVRDNRSRDLVMTGQLNPPPLS